MRRALVSHDNTAAASGLALSFAPHQHLDTGGQPVDLVLLGGHDIGQIVNAAQKMGDVFFELFHALHLIRFVRPRNARRTGRRALAPLARIR